MEYLVGVLLAMVLCGGAAFLEFDRDRAFYPIALIVIASYYVLFAAMSGAYGALLAETAIASAFILTAVIGFKKNLWLVVVGLASHGILDFMHHLIVENPGVPIWWPGFCLAADVVFAGLLAVLLLKRSNIAVKRNASQAARPLP